MVKPRSLLDTIVVIRDLAAQMKVYAMRSELVIDGPQFASMLNLLETAITRLSPWWFASATAAAGSSPGRAHSLKEL